MAIGDQQTIAQLDRRARVAATIVVVAWLTALVGRLATEPAIDRVIRAGLHADAARDGGLRDWLSKAAELAPHHSWTVWLRLRHATAEHRDEEALALTRLVLELHPSLDLRIAATLAQAQRAWALADVVGCETAALEVLRLSPQQPDAHRLLMMLYQYQGRTWESQAHALARLREGTAHSDELFALNSSPRLFFGDEQLLNRWQEAQPDEPLVQLPRARRDLLSDQTAQGRTTLEQIVARHPTVWEAQGRLGRLILESDGPAAARAWWQQLEAGADGHPEVLLTKARLELQEGDRVAAARTLIAAVRLAPNHAAAVQLLAAQLRLLGQPEAAKRLAVRAEQLGRLEGATVQLRDDPAFENGRAVAEQCLELGRTWEAAGWARTWVQMLGHAELRLQQERALGREAPSPSWLAEARAWLPDFSGRVAKTLGQSAELVVEHEHPLFGVDAMGLTESVRPTDRPNTVDDRHEVVRPQLALIDQAAEVGLVFELQDGRTNENRLEHIFNTIGAGAAALDYDRDGWPDVYFAQGADWRNSTEVMNEALWQKRVSNDRAAGFLDELHRNRGGHFSRVPWWAFPAETRHSYGVSVADYDEDGFPDVFVANLAGCRLFRNQGDGSLVVAEGEADLQRFDWSIGGCWADFSGDGLLDLYVGNYGELASTRDRSCHGGAVESTCSPGELRPAADRLFLSLGDGRFREISKESGIDRVQRFALGLVAADFDQDGRVDVFVGNDTLPNSLWQNVGHSPEGAPQFDDIGAAVGVAADADGGYQACMGVASGDLNNDGTLDLFVTNFMRESNTFYAGQAGGQFFDETRAAGLREPSMNMLGFGSQALDVDGDGRLELFVTNGHVNARAATGVDDVMPPQLFWNRGGGRFVDASDTVESRYFRGKFLGRGVLRLDWNRDGRDDLLVTHLDRPAALLTNQSAHVRSTVRVSLVGRKSPRHAVGSRAGLEIRDDRPVSTWMTGGDGYLCTNEPLLSFKWSIAADAEWAQAPTANTRVQWHSGASELLSLGTRGDYVIREERQPVLLEKQERQSHFSSGIPEINVR